MSDLTALLEAAKELELAFSRCYEELGKTVPDLSMSEELRILSRDEIVHANMLERGAEYAALGPELFSEASTTIRELTRHRDAVSALTTKIVGQGTDVATALAQLADLELLLADVHMARIVKIEEPGLKKLFDALSAEDRRHVQRVHGLLARLPPKG